MNIRPEMYNYAYEFICKKFILLFAILFAVLMVVHHFELPYGSGLRYLLSTRVSYHKKFHFAVRGQSSSDFASDRNKSLKGNQTSFQKISGQLKDDRKVVGNGTVEKAMDIEHNVLSYGFNERGILVRSFNQNGNSDSSLDLSAASPAPAINNSSRDVIPRPIESNFTVSINNLALTDFPAVNKTNDTATTLVMPISKMNEFLHQSHLSPRSLPRQFYSKVDENLVYARSQIENGPIVNNDIDLYAPLYRNVSMFKRSYEIMESMLKVYIYEDGERPIFHDSILEGIYSSEGWFLKLLEANKQFVTKDPGVAHLFYLPFSSRLLQLTLYVKHSHNRENLIQYMKSYVEMLIKKYPYWNRTNGADHFLAACHDWAPAETRGRMLNCIRALCNADIKTGFSIGKDVSIPTTYVRSAHNPSKDIGGNSPSERPILAFFAGYMHGNVRPVLIQHWGNDSDMRIFSRMPQVKGNKNYIQHMKSSRYCICARGFAVHSPRVVESIFYECVPVIISDNYVPPLFEVLNWESFAVFILERDIPNLKKILLSISEKKYLEMQKRVKRVQKHFLWHAEPLKYDLFHMILHSIWYNRVFRTAPV